MTKTLQGALVLLLNIGSFYGLSWFEYPRGHHRPYISYLYILATLSLYTYFTILIFYEDWKNRVTDWVDSIKEISTITSILISLFRFKELKMCLYELSIVDDTLEALGVCAKRIPTIA
ncbi:hypothetical protein ALC53_00882 [Atta colombica]|uniref:Gustatory receptor n=1 Tax=Atta colombica TaxID=520822 RepID=A0A195BV18_9HYME|nr:hypothetical protein ALC53_00882 [Atta colombica]